MLVEYAFSIQPSEDQYVYLTNLILYTLSLDIRADDMQSIKEIFRKNGLPVNATDIPMKSWNCGTSKQYLPHILCWCDFCSSQNVNPFNSSIYDNAKILTQYFLRSECKYSVNNTARSVLSSIFPSGKGLLTFGKQPIIQWLLKGMFKEKGQYFLDIQ